MRALPLMRGLFRNRKSMAPTSLCCRRPPKSSCPLPPTTASLWARASPAPYMLHCAPVTTRPLRRFNGCATTMQDIPPEQSLIEYPSDFPIKVMGRAHPHFAQTLTDRSDEHTSELQSLM